jgi:hypothetical protein
MMRKRNEIVINDRLVDESLQRSLTSTEIERSHAEPARGFWAIVAFFRGVSQYFLTRRLMTPLNGDSMSASLAKDENQDREEKSKGSPLLSTVLESDRVVSVSADDFFERTRGMDAEEFSNAFEKKVNGHSGFSASLRRASR